MQKFSLECVPIGHESFLNSRMSNNLTQEDLVLSTLERDGSRRWLKPKLSKGSLLTRRRWMAYFLIAVFTLVPFLRINGKPLMLLDIPARRFTILGYTFLPTDTVLLAILTVGILLSIFLFTALFGRVWCGWACPQTVYMEFLYRPIERFFDGTAGRGGQHGKIPAWRTAAKYVVYFIISVYLANTFLAYFVGVDQLKVWVTRSPFQHPTSFLVMALVTVAIMFDFCYFREQMCLIACPYGRMQSVLLDRNSLIVSYDVHRGEPRGKRNRKLEESYKEGAVQLPVVGDCVDCGNCVTTCPTGIDIRKGLQMECINCTQCIDACNQVMEKLDRAPNLIRFASLAKDNREVTSLIRPRTLVYPALLLGIVAAFVSVFLATKTFDAVILREAGNPFVMTEDGRVRNLIKLKITNRTEELMKFSVRVVQPSSAAIEVQQSDFQLAANETSVFNTSVIASRDVFKKGKSSAIIEITNDAEVERTLRFTLLGPF